MSHGQIGLATMYSNQDASQRMTRDDQHSSIGRAWSPYGQPPHPPLLSRYNPHVPRPRSTRRYPEALKSAQVREHGSVQRLSGFLFRAYRAPSESAGRPGAVHLIDSYFNNSLRQPKPETWLGLRI
jgi:hypothetical protein